MVVVRSLSRFTRDPVLQAVSYERLQAAGVDQVSVVEHRILGRDFVEGYLEWENLR